MAANGSGSPSVGDRTVQTDAVAVSALGVVFAVLSFETQRSRLVLVRAGV